MTDASKPSAEPEVRYDADNDQWVRKSLWAAAEERAQKAEKERDRLRALLEPVTWTTRDWPAKKLWQERICTHCRALGKSANVETPEDVPFIERHDDHCDLGRALRAPSCEPLPMTRVDAEIRAEHARPNKRALGTAPAPKKQEPK